MQGYHFGQDHLEKSPVSLEELDLLKKTLLWSEQDDKYLKMAAEILKNQTNEILDLWYGFVGSQPHLVQYFATNGTPNVDYLSAVKARFGQWILDVCQKSYDQNWLNYQHEIAKRHHTLKKNMTDQVDSPPIVHFRYIIAFIFPITFTIKGFLGNNGHSLDEVEMMYHAWFKAVTLTALLWCHPYIRENEF